MDIRHRNGLIAELFVAQKLVESGYEIYLPFATQSRCDLMINEITTGGSNFSLKVQVKKATWSKTGRFEYLQARISGKNKETNTPYKAEDVDMFAFTDLKRVWMAYYEDVGRLTSVCLDSSNPDYKPKTKYNAKDWILKDVLNAT